MMIYRQYQPRQPDDIKLCPVCGEIILYERDGNYGNWVNAHRISRESGYFVRSVNSISESHVCTNSLIVSNVMMLKQSQVLTLSNGKKYKLSLQHLFPVGANVIVNSNGNVIRLSDAIGNPKSMMARMSTFSIDDGPAFKGYTTGNHWNGWAMPNFPKSEADRLATYESSLCPGTYLRYNKKTDSYDYFDSSMYDKDTPENIESWPGQDVYFMDGSIVHVYDIGSGCWIWDENPVKTWD